MKRSEMLKTIEAFLSNYYNQGPADTHDDAALNLLEILEKAGMAPPEIIESVTTEFVDIRSGMLMMTEHSGVYVRKWEPEDE